MILFSILEWLIVLRLKGGKQETKDLILSTSFVPGRQSNSLCLLFMLSGGGKDDFYRAKSAPSGLFSIHNLWSNVCLFLSLSA